MELAKLPFMGEYHLLHTPFKKWDEKGRPVPKNVKFVDHYDSKENYDLAILHVDQQCVEPRIAKGRIIKELLPLIDCKKVVINHQTPFSDRLSTGDTIKEMKALVGDAPMIVNSKKSKEQWGWGYPIIHGMEVDEWYDLPKEPRAITCLTPAGMENAYKRSFLLAVHERCREAGINFKWIGYDISRFPTFEEYKEYIGRSLIFLNGTMNSPMPRARTEAMLSGACTITLDYHDIGDYIENGVNGFIIPRNPESAVKLISELLTTRYDEAVEIGKRGREMARKNFNSENFAKQWVEFLNLTYPGIL